MNFFNKRYNQSYEQFDNDFDENWGENYYPDSREFFDEGSKKREKFDKKEVKSQNYYEDDYDSNFDCRKGQSHFCLKPCFQCHCTNNRPCFNRPCHQPCNRPCWERPCNRPCHNSDDWKEECGYDRPTKRPEKNGCNDALLFLSGYFIAKRCK